MAMFKGTSALVSCYKGAAQIQKIYKGSVEVWSSFGDGDIYINGELNPKYALTISPTENAGWINNGFSMQSGYIQINSSTNQYETNGFYITPSIDISKFSTLTIKFYVSTALNDGDMMFAALKAGTAFNSTGHFYQYNNNAPAGTIGTWTMDISAVDTTDYLWINDRDATYISHPKRIYEIKLS